MLITSCKNIVLILTALFMLLLPPAGHAATVQLPRTGQSGCWDVNGTPILCAGSGQDGARQVGKAWPATRFVDNGDQTVSDSLTGLIWAKDANLVVSRDPAFDLDGTANDGLVTWQHALDYVAKLNTENYLGHNDWRLPNINELKSLVNLQQPDQGAWLKSQNFQSVAASSYWSSTSYGTLAKSVYMVAGTLGTSSKSIAMRAIWPVRGISDVLPRTGQTVCYATTTTAIDCTGTGQDGELQTGLAWPASRFVINADQTVTDDLTGLVWSQDANPAAAAMTWQAALEYVNTLNSQNFLGYNDWRLPNREELGSLMDLSQTSQTAWLTTAGFSNVQASRYASSSTYTNTEHTHAEYDWVAYMPSGTLTSLAKNDATHYVWPVRGGTFDPFAVIPSATGFGTISPAYTAGYVPYGTAVSYTISPEAGYRVALPVGGTCPQGVFDQTGSIYSTGAIYGDCSVSFSFIPLAYEAAALVQQTGQTASYGVGDNGYLRPGVQLPSPRFVDKGDGTVIDTLTGLVWLKDSNCFGGVSWAEALSRAGAVSHGSCGLNDNSTTGDWRLPNRNELRSLIDYSRTSPALPVDHLFSPSQQPMGDLSYWTSTGDASLSSNAWGVSFDDGRLASNSTSAQKYVAAVKRVAATIPSSSVTFTPTAGGTISGTAMQDVNVGGSTTAVTAVPATGYTFTGWTGASGFSSNMNPLVLYGVTTSQSITAVFVRTYTVSSSVNGGNGSIRCTTPVNQGASSACSIIPDSGYHLAALTDNGANVLSAAGVNGYSISNVAADHVIAGTFVSGAGDGVCGASAEGIFPAAPSTALCSVGTASAVTVGDMWKWSCHGVSGGTTVNCGAYIKIQPPRTGQTGCWDGNGTSIPCTGTGQDGDLQSGLPWPASRFSDNGDQTMTDNLTGLIWSKDTNPAAATKTWQQALDYIKTLNSGNYQGHNDWRLPNINELRSLAALSQYGSATWLSNQGFAGVVSGNYWSSSSYSGYNGGAWYISTSSGSVRNDYKSSAYYVWPVRGGQPGASGMPLIPKTGQIDCYDASGTSRSCNGTGEDGELQSGASWPNSRFSVSAVQTVTDNLTGLMWSQDANPAAAGKTWQEALDYIKTLNSSNWLGYSDWRLPNREELASLLFWFQGDQSTWLNSQGFNNVQSSTYWSSSTVAGGATSAWVIKMGNSSAIGSGIKSGTNSIWPVRGDAIPPRVVSGSPAFNASGVAVDATLTVTFSEPVDLSSLPPANRILMGNGEYVSGTVSHSADNTTFTFTPTAPLSYNTVYTVAYRDIRDMSGNVIVPTYGTFTTAVKPANTFVPTLSLALSSNGVILGSNGVSPVNASGAITAGSGTLLGQTVTLSVMRPDKQTVNIYTTADAAGGYLAGISNALTTPGTYQVQAFAGSASGTITPVASPPATIRVLPVAGYAIIVQGRIPGGEGEGAHAKTASRVKSALLARGYTADNINHIISSDFDSGKTALSSAITTWATTKLTARSAPLQIILIDHGEPSTFHMGSDTVTPAELAGWLDTLEAGLPAAALTQPRTIVIGSCYSGSFIPLLAKTGRYIITSASSGEQSFRGPDEPDKIRSGEYFLDELYGSLKKGASLRDAFNASAKTLHSHSRRGGIVGSSNDKPLQHALFSYGGDTKGQTEIPTGIADDAPDILYLGSGDNGTYNPAGMIPQERHAREKSVYLDQNTSNTTISHSAAAGQDAWLELRAPSARNIQDNGSSQLTVTLPGQAMTENPAGTYSAALTGLAENGTYDVTIYTKPKGDTSAEITRTMIPLYRSRATNSAPLAPVITTPASGTTGTTALIVTWDETIDPDGDQITYTLLISKNADMSDPALVREGLIDPFDIITFDDGLLDLTVYHLQVIAIDSYGAKGKSAITTISTNNTNGLIGYVKGKITSSSGGAVIPGATLGLGGTTTKSLGNGAYLMATLPGTATITASADGYLQKTVELTAAPGKVTTRNIVIDPTAPVSYLITTTVAGNGFIDCPASATANSTISCSIQAGAGYQYSAITGCGGTLTGNQYSAVITGDCGISASFIPVETAAYKISGTTATGGSVVCVPATVSTGGSSTCNVLPLAGYKLATLSDNGNDIIAKIQNGSAVISDIIADHALSAAFTVITPPKAGDCDNDNTVTIAEVQSAINMFLGLKAVATCVDTDSNGSVSIAEVQKTINSFLGL